MQIKHDPAADAVYVSFSEGRSAYTQDVDESRFVDFDQQGALLGIEFLNVDSGMRVGGLPVDIIALARALRQEGLPVLDGLEVVTNLSRRTVVNLGHGLESGNVNFNVQGSLWVGGSPTIPKVGTSIFASYAPVAHEGMSGTTVTLIAS